MRGKVPDLFLSEVMLIDTGDKPPEVLLEGKWIMFQMRKSQTVMKVYRHTASRNRVGWRKENI